MSGAFVAVADDATASWWNPAGLATGAYLSATVERGRTTEPANPTAQGPAARTTSGNFAVAFPALGLSYYRVHVREWRPGSTAVAGADRQDPRGGGSSVRSLSVSQFGTTVGQSFGEHLVVGSTLKLLFAGAVTASAATSDPLDAADELDVPRHVRTDLDAGAMVRFGHVRAGLTVRNITEPTFGDENTDRLTLQRQARVGVAFLSAPLGALQGFTVAGDADLRTLPTAVGDVRHVAGGVEGWLGKGRFGVRAGASANTVGQRRPAASGGVSVALTRAFHVNASRTVGRDQSVTGWSTSVSLAF
jgi:hypothetical protein